MSVQSEAKVTSSAPVKLFYLDKKTYLQLYCDKLDRIRKHTQKLVH